MERFPLRECRSVNIRASLSSRNAEEMPLADLVMSESDVSLGDATRPLCWNAMMVYPDFLLGTPALKISSAASRECLVWRITFCSLGP